MTQSPKLEIGTGLSLKYFTILEQPNRNFALSHDWGNLYIISQDRDKTIIREYVYQPPSPPKSHWRSPFNNKSEPEISWHEESGEYLNGARMVLVSVDNLENPSYCQLKILDVTKTYKFNNKINRIEVQDAFR